MSLSESPEKPKALRSASRVAFFSPASPPEPHRVFAGTRELVRLGFDVGAGYAPKPDGYFAAPLSQRRLEFFAALRDPLTVAVIATRGGYGSAYFLDEALPAPPSSVSLIGFSDLTTLQIYFWQKYRRPSFYGPMVAAGFDAGADKPGGYDLQSFRNALMNPISGWQANLSGETLRPGSANGTLLGGAMTLLEATLGTPWELDTADSILFLEDRAMKPYQVDRVLLHLKHAGKFKNVRGVLLGDFPECDPPVANSPSVREVAHRILASLNIPIVFGAPIGHTARPMLTLPLGVPARLIAEGSGTLEFLEPTVCP